MSETNQPGEYPPETVQDAQYSLVPHPESTELHLPHSQIQIRDEAYFRRAATIAQKKSAIMALAPTIQADKFHKHGGYWYASTHAMMSTMRPLMAERGLSLSFQAVGTPAIAPHKDKPDIYKVEHKFLFVLTDAETGAQEETIVPEICVGSIEDAYGKNLRGALRNYLYVAFMLDVNDDPPDKSDAQGRLEAIPEESSRRRDETLKSMLVKSMDEFPDYVARTASAISSRVPREFAAITEAAIAEAKLQHRLATLIRECLRKDPSLFYSVQSIKEEYDMLPNHWKENIPIR